MKKSPFAIIAALLLPFAASLQAQQPAVNVYDLLSRVLVPIASVFSPEAKQHALSTTLVLEEMTDLPPEFIGTRLELLVQPPDRLLLRGPYGGQTVTICRAGESVWITPNTPPFDALATPASELPKKKQPTGLGQMILPIPPQQLALLPILLQVKDAGEENGVHSMDVKLMPELARSLGVDGWRLHLSVDAAGQPTRLRIVGPGWKIALRVERLQYATELPAATWQTPPDAVRLDSLQIQQWLDVISNQVEAHRPKNVQ